MRFRVRWPDGTPQSFYSPSLVIKDYLAVGAAYAVSDFVARSRAALAIASDRVAAKYGVACSRAARSSTEIEAAAARFGDAADAAVIVEAFEE
jgi:uncharacterized repeat protein (TIGR04042 family)